MVPKDEYEFKLSQPELLILKSIGERDDALAALLESKITPQGPKSMIRVSRSEAEHLRDGLTHYLAEVGFDENYSPTKRGRLIEDLIDRLFIP